MKKIYYFLPILIVILPLIGFLLFPLINDKNEVTYVPETIKNEIQLEIDKANTTKEISPNVVNKYQNAEEAVKFLFATVTMENESLFLEAFQPEHIIKDLSLMESQDKIKVIHDVMDRISRKNTIKEIKILKRIEFSNGNRVHFNIVIAYKDDKNVETEIDATLTPIDAHNAESIYLISSSIWDLIQDIEK